MAKFNRTDNGIAWLQITWFELAVYSANLDPICDDCRKDLVGCYDNIILIPLLNQAYCPECGKKVLNRIVNYVEDRPYAAHKKRFWLDYFGIEEGVT